MSCLRKYLRSLAEHDPDASFKAYPQHLRETTDYDIQFDFALLQKSAGNVSDALQTIRTLLQSSRKPEYLLAECDLLACSGDPEKALVLFEQLIRDELTAGNDTETLPAIIGRYRRVLSAHMPAEDAEKRFLALVSRDVNVVGLTETARFYEDLGNAIEARAWYYRAYRADFLTGGLAFATFLSLHGEERECEKVMLYVLSNVKKSADLAKVAAVVVSESGRMHRLQRLMEQLIHRLGERRSTLGSEGLELLARAFFIAAVNALEEMDYASCKYYCLSGMDVMPSHTDAIHLGEFLQVIMDCKEKSVADRPIMNTGAATTQAGSGFACCSDRERTGDDRTRAEDCSVPPPAPDRDRGVLTQTARHAEDRRDCQPSYPEGGCQGVVTDTEEGGRRGW